MDILESQTRQFYKLLGHDGLYSQLHCQNIKTKQLIDRRLVYGEEEVIKWAKEFNGVGNCFIGRAPRNKDGSVIESACLSLDIDPEKEKGSAATQDQWEEAIQAGRSVLRALSYGVLCSSGNGSLILFPLRERVPKEVAEKLGKSLEDAARTIVKGAKVSVDSTFDLARLAKLAGTLSTKGDQCLWRTARILETSTSGIGSYETLMGTLSTNVARVQEPESNALPNQILGNGTAGVGSRVESQGLVETAKALQIAADSLKRLSPARCDEYETWLKVGIILKDYGPAGFRMWNEWSRLSKSYDARVCRDKWNSFRPDQSITVGTLKYWADQDTPVVPGTGNGRANVQVQLWTPENGLYDYKNRKQPGEPELPTGFKTLDAATFGLIRGHIFTVGARTNCGKTSFAISVASHLCGLSKRVLFMSTETQYAEIWDRYIAASTGIQATRIQHGLMSETDTACFNQFINVFKQQQLFVYDSSRPSIHTVREAVNQANPDVLIFDYFQHVEGRETKELEEFVMQVKELAKEKQIAVLMCAQLHDGFPNPKTGKVPQPSMRDIKNCKVLNDESRVVILLDWDRDAVQGDGATSVKVLLAKNKGARQDCTLKLDRSVPRFENE